MNMLRFFEKKSRKLRTGFFGALALSAALPTQANFAPMQQNYAQLAATLKQVVRESVMAGELTVPIPERLLDGSCSSYTILTDGSLTIRPLDTSFFDEASVDFSSLMGTFDLGAHFKIRVDARANLRTDYGTRITFGGCSDLGTDHWYATARGEAGNTLTLMAVLVFEPFTNGSRELLVPKVRFIGDLDTDIRLVDYREHDFDSEWFQSILFTFESAKAAIEASSRLLRGEFPLIPSATAQRLLARGGLSIIDLIDDGLPKDIIIDAINREVLDQIEPGLEAQVAAAFGEFERRVNARLRNIMLSRPLNQSFWNRLFNGLAPRLTYSGHCQGSSYRYTVRARPFTNNHPDLHFFVSRNSWGSSITPTRTGSVITKVNPATITESISYTDILGRTTHRSITIDAPLCLPPGALPF